jgi:hypothetical protein
MDAELCSKSTSTSSRNIKAVISSETRPSQQLHRTFQPSAYALHEFLFPMAFLATTAILCLSLITTSLPQPTSPGLHLPLFRRGGRFSVHEPANLTYLTQILNDVEAKYARTYRAVEGNRLVRRWRQSEAKDENDPEVIGVAGRENSW